jgi:type IV secretion system protein TrbI
MDSASRNNKTRKQTETAQTGSGPATTVEKGMLSDQARNGLDIGQIPRPGFCTTLLHCNRRLSGWPVNLCRLEQGPEAKPARSHLLNTGRPRCRPPSNGSLSFAEQRRLEEYNREREAMEAATSVKGNLPGEDKEKQNAETDPLQAIQAALINARSALGANPRKAAFPNPPAHSLPGRDQQEQRTDYERQNDQQQKAGFGQQHGKQESDYLNSARKPALGKYEIKAGWLIPAVLEQQLNSDLPGLIRALVRENVYDSATGRYILVPAGSTLVGIYNSHVGYGQNALQAVWRRVIFPTEAASRSAALKGTTVLARRVSRPGGQSLGPNPLRRSAHVAFLRRNRAEPGDELLGAAIAERRATGGASGRPASRPTGSRGYAQEPEHPANDCGEAGVQVLCKG